MPTSSNQFVPPSGTSFNIALQGPPGPPGPPGANGPAGPIGPDGEQGPTGPTSTVPGPVGPQGPQGETGPASTVPGPQGIQGPQGPAGTPGATGADSTVPGPMGPTGPQGPQGAPGAASTVPGPQGPMGPAGADGTNGAPGATGATGATGPEGPIGPQGPQGIQGVAGTSAGPPSDTLPLVDGTAAAGALLTYARGDHVHPREYTTVNMGGAKSFDVAVPAGATIAKINGVIFPTTASQITLLIQCSLSAGVFLTTAGDYGLEGFFHQSATTPTAVAAINGTVTQVGMQVANGNVSINYPIIFDGQLILKRPDTTNSRFAGDFRAATNNASGWVHSFLYNHITLTPSGSFTSMLAFRVMSAIGDNWGAGSMLNVEWR